MTNFDPLKQPSESYEQYSHRLNEAILAEDWKLRFQANTARYRSLGDTLRDEQDPEMVIDLTLQRGTSFTRILGSGAISL